MGERPSKDEIKSALVGMNLDLVRLDLPAFATMLAVHGLSAATWRDVREALGELIEELRHE